MGYRSLYDIKQDSIQVGLTLFYLSAFVLIVFLKKERYMNDSNSNNNITIKDDIKSVEKVDEEIFTISSPTSPKQSNLSSPTNTSPTNTSPTNTSPTYKSPTNTSPPNTLSPTLMKPIEVIASGPTTIDDNHFMELLKKGIPIQRTKDKKGKKKMIIINDNFKLIIKSVTNKYATIKERALDTIDDVCINDENQNGFSLLFKEGRKVTKYDLVAESESQRDFIVHGLLSLKESEKKNTSTIIASIGGSAQ